MRARFSCFSSFSGKLIPKVSLDVFANTLTGDGKYPVKDCENLQLPIQMQLYQKWKSFSEFFVAFLESASTFKHFE